MILPATAEVKVPSLIGDNMVLQQEAKVHIWGTAQPGEQVTVIFQAQTGQTVANAQGRWNVELGPYKAGGPYELKISGQNTLSFSNVLVGELWVCSGQSNMEFMLVQSANGSTEVAQAKFPSIRFFTVKKKTSLEPLEEVEGKWEECSPANAGSFSAVGYFFGRELSKHLNIPIGLIHTSWGGTLAEAWTSMEALKSETATKPIATRLEKVLAENPPGQAKKEDTEDSGYYQDPGNKGLGLGYAQPNLDLTGWKKMALPQFWENTGLDIDGAVWFRKEVELPASWKGKDLLLSLGPVDDFDTTYFDGTQVGGIGPENPGAYSVPRKYTIPARQVNPGKHLIAVRVFDHFGNGGLGGDPSELFVAPVETPAPASISLAGSWDYRVELALKPKMNVEKLGPGNPNTPTALYNAMIAPLTPLPIRGAIWYQGESNADRAYQYRTLLPLMIQDWRHTWNEEQFPFFLVQLANFMGRVSFPGESHWAELREAQLLTTRLPNTGMAVTIDIGDAKDIHPKNKQDVGLRLALLALHHTYGKELVFSGPSFVSAKINEKQIRLSFDNTGSGLTTKNNEPLKGFAIAGADRKFVWADAQIEGSDVVVSSATVGQPLAVRYGWANNPECNLINKEGLPASPFRTDDWPGLTVGKE
jgi:sialate O-acetylesterase